MNPALLLVAALLGTGMLLVGIFAALYAWLPPVPAIVLAAVGLTVETVAALALARARRRPASAAAAQGQARR